MWNTIKEVGIKITMAISDYFRLGEYFKVKWRQYRGKGKDYLSEAIFWRDALGTEYYQKGVKKIFGGEAVRLKDFNLTEWFPRSPGRFWTSYGQELREEADRYIEKIINKGLFADIIYTPIGKSMKVLGGIGNVRFLEHGEPERYKLLSATVGENASAGIPVVMTTRAYEKISKKISESTTVKAEITGFYAPLPSELDRLIARAPGVPRYCIFVDSPLLIRNVQPGGKVVATAWTLFESDSPPDYYFCYCYFDPFKEEHIKEAADFINEYVEKHEGKMLTDFDEIVPRFDAAFTLTEVAEGRLDNLTINDLLRKVRKHR